MVSAHERQQPEQDPPGYRLLGRLGRGAQADVMLGVRLADERRFAIKVVRHDDLDRHQPDAIARLRREARLLQTVDSPHVVAVHELLTTASASYLVMDLLAGESLAKECNRRAGIARMPLPADAAQVTPTTTPPSDPDATRVLSPDERERIAPSRTLRPDDVPAGLRTKDHTDWVIGIGLQIARGLDHLHAINLIHRDIKPANVMLVDDGIRAVITDFGMAHQEGVSTITRVDHRSGTPHYWSPEQAGAGRCTAASDVFSLGATLFDCLTGWSPLHQRPMEPPSTWRLPRLSRLRPDLPRPLTQVLTRALELDPRDRYPDAAALLADLLRCERQLPIHIPFSVGRTWRHHRRAVLLTLTVAALAVGGLLVRDWLLDRNRAASLATAARDRDPDLLRMWHALSPRRQDDLLQPLNERLADAPDALRHMARTCGLAAVEIAATDTFQVALCSVTDPPPSLDTFVRPIAGTTLLARPGYTWLLVVPVHASLWWDEQDPLCLFYLREFAPAGPTEEPAAAQAPWTAVRHTLEGLRNWLPGEPWLPVPPAPTVGIATDGAPLFVLRHEFGEGPFGAFLKLHTREALAGDHLSNNAHPQEPADALPAMLATPAAGIRSTLPALADFWAAWRLATSLGAMLPTRGHWERAAAGAIGETRPPGERLPVDAPPHTDKSTCGAHWIRGNASEWLMADTYRAPPLVAFPGANGPGGITQTATQERHGIRLVRYRIPLHR
ncbi:MAG: serine/threonine protein kinase [Planctomycetes bacterium]|nr:serine/threonine protein kinase [Planctomycetota bacterium]